MSSRIFSKARICAVSFTGSRKDYFVWDSKFLAKAGMLMFKKIISATIKIPTETEYSAVVAVDEQSRSTPHKKTIRDFDLNMRAFDDLILAMDGSLNEEDLLGV